MWLGSEPNRMAKDQLEIISSDLSSPLIMKKVGSMKEVKYRETLAVDLVGLTLNSACELICNGREVDFEILEGGC